MDKTLLERTVALAESTEGFGARQLRAVLDKPRHNSRYASAEFCRLMVAAPNLCGLHKREQPELRGLGALSP